MPRQLNFLRVFAFTTLGNPLDPLAPYLCLLVSDTSVGGLVERGDGQHGGV